MKKRIIFNTNIERVRKELDLPTSVSDAKISKAIKFSAPIVCCVCQTRIDIIASKRSIWADPTHVALYEDLGKEAPLIQGPIEEVTQKNFHSYYLWTIGDALENHIRVIE